MRPRSSGLLDKRNHNDPTVVSEVPKNVIEYKICVTIIKAAKKKKIVILSRNL